MAAAIDRGIWAWYSCGMVNLPKRAGLAVLILYFALAAFSAESYLLTRLNHEHSLEAPGESCTVCYGIASARLFLEGLGRTGLLVLAALCMACLRGPVEKSASLVPAALTPVALKTRLNF
jgi:hypothetical protein